MYVSSKRVYIYIGFQTFWQMGTISSCNKFTVHFVWTIKALSIKFKGVLHLSTSHHTLLPYNGYVPNCYIPITFLWYGLKMTKIGRHALPNYVALYQIAREIINTWTFSFVQIFSQVFFLKYTRTNGW